MAQDVWGERQPIRLPIGGEGLLDWLTAGQHANIVLRRGKKEPEILVYAKAPDRLEYIGCLALTTGADGWLMVTPRLFDESYRLAFLRIEARIMKLAAESEAEIDRQAEGLAEKWAEEYARMRQTTLPRPEPSPREPLAAIPAAPTREESPESTPDTASPMLAEDADDPLAAILSAANRESVRRYNAGEHWESLGRDYGLDSMKAVGNKASTLRSVFGADVVHYRRNQADLDEEEED
ncbi:MAG TPA: hypothetical protein PLJ35_20020 [Anaerolineae bacterium]|nr:hypothetical protein [Anaerolineae bacterium]HPL28308.1 hypothetical protein [Anaerolineae bacterium]